MEAMCLRDYAFNSILRFPSRSILAQPNMHFIVPCRADRRAAVTHSSKIAFLRYVNRGPE